MNFDDFQHNNMQPFFGSRIKQNLRSSANRTLLENFTGIEEQGMKQAKREIGPLFKMKPNPEAVFGNPVNADRHLDRFQTSRIRNNETPFEKIYVAPGLNQEGFQAQGVNGYNQVGSDNSYVMPKTVDELRVGNRKRTTYTPPVIAGRATSQRGQFGKLYQNRPNPTEVRSGSERFFVTACGNEAATQRPDEINAKETGRQSIPGFEFGHAVGPRALGGATANVADSVKSSDRQQLDEFGLRNLFSAEGMGEEFDFGRDNIEMPAQERDATTEATYQGNLTSLVKAVVAPLADIMRVSRKEYDVAHARPYGQLQSSVRMATVKDPNDVARTTIKETLIHDTREGNVKGSTALYVYDPEEVARTTIRETTASATEAHPGNVQTLQRSDAYLGANVEAKPTQKEALSDNDYFGSAISGVDKRSMSYDEFMNANINVLKEGTLKGRAPTYQGDKQNASADDLGLVETKRLGIDEESQRTFNNIDRYTGRGKMDACETVHFTKHKAQLPDRSVSDRNVDTAVLSSLETNPFAMKPISCSA
jgi:hypothetical protein